MPENLPPDLLEKGPEQLMWGVQAAGGEHAYIDSLLVLTKYTATKQLFDAACSLSEHDSMAEFNQHSQSNGFLDGTLIGLDMVSRYLPDGTLDRLAMVDICEIEYPDDDEPWITSDQRSLLLERSSDGYRSASAYYKRLFDQWSLPNVLDSDTQRRFMKYGFGAVMWRLQQAQREDRQVMIPFIMDMVDFQAIDSSKWDDWASSLDQTD